MVCVLGMRLCFAALSHVDIRGKEGGEGRGERGGGRGRGEREEGGRREGGFPFNCLWYVHMCMRESIMNHVMFVYRHEYLTTV